jgi:recombinational DNA repair ATPase RecF
MGIGETLAHERLREETRHRTAQGTQRLASGHRHQDVARTEESGQRWAFACVLLHALRVLPNQARVARLEQRA